VHAPNRARRTANVFAAAAAGLAAIAVYSRRLIRRTARKS